MCSALRRTRVAGLRSILAIAGAGSVASPITAQSVSDYRSRVDQLAQLWRSASVAAARAESLQLRAVEIDTIVAGALVVMTRSSYQETVREATRLAWGELHATLGSDTVLLRGHRFYTQPDTVRAPTPVFRGENVREFAFSDEGDAADIAARIVRNAGLALQSDIDDATMVNWLRGFKLRLKQQTDADWSRIYVELATAPSRASRQCYIGDLEACRYALGLATVDDPVARLYNAQERRRLVERLYRRMSRHPGAQPCVAGGSDASCLEVLRAAPELVPPPLSVNARGSLLQLALEVGGDGASSRLIGSEVPTVELHLAAVAGVSPDSLPGLWRDRVVAARPQPTTLTRAAGWVAFLWVVAFAVVASRSTRWRSG